MLTPGYGETSIPDNELEALLPQARQLLDVPFTKAALFDLEQGVEEQVTEALLEEVTSGTRALEALLGDHFLRELHHRLFGEIWSWAGLFRRQELNIGVDPTQIAVQLRVSLQNIHYRWENTKDWNPHQLGIAAHAEAVRIHPFTDGNGRCTRLLANLVYVAAQLIVAPDSSELSIYDYSQLEKAEYIALLREYDNHRDPTRIAAIVAVQSLGD